jgi:succinate dehydrogenase assembly factor 1
MTDGTSFLRMVRTKPPPARAHFLLMVRHAFHTNARAVAVRDVNTVEHLLRRGRRQLAVYADVGVRDCAVSDAMRAWERDVYNRRA